MSYPPLKFLHDETSLNEAKLDQLRKLSADRILTSLAPGQQSSLKTRADGTLIEGHHRIKILCQRGIDVDCLPREIVPKIEP